jgi:sugar phosphate isomerase/epimerase
LWNKTAINITNNILQKDVKRLKIGLNPAFLFAHFGDKVFFEQVMKGAAIAKNLGFPSLGLEIYCDEQYSAYTPENIRQIRQCFNDLGLKSTAFLACAPRAKLASITKEINQEGKEDFRRIVEIVAEMGLTDVISLVTSAPPETVISFMETYPGAPPESTVLPPTCSWGEVWNTYVDTVGECLAMVKSAGLRLAIEPLPMSIVSTTDSYLRLADEIRSNDLGILIDTSHLFFQRESLPVAIEKVKDQLFGFCACDNDGALDYHWAPGQGRINWRQVLKTLQKVGYQGSIDLEINIADDPDATYLQARAYLNQIIKEM